MWIFITPPEQKMWRQVRIPDFELFQLCKQQLCRSVHWHKCWRDCTEIGGDVHRHKWWKCYTKEENVHTDTDRRECLRDIGLWKEENVRLYIQADTNVGEILNRRKKGRSRDPTLGLQFVQSNQPLPHSCVQISQEIFHKYLSMRGAESDWVQIFVLWKFISRLNPNLS